MRLVEEHRRLERAGAIVQRVFRNSREGFREIERLERPAADAERIEAWVAGEFRSLAVAIRAGAVLADGKVDRFNRMFARAARIDRDAQRHIRGFEPRHCTS